MGGDSAKEQMRSLQEGVDIVCGTPGRLDDLISTGRLDLSGVREKTTLVYNYCLSHDLCVLFLML